jgi:hypothetical protein
MPMLAFDLRLKSAGLPLLEVSDTSSAMAAAGQVDADQLGRFLLTTLTFIGQPRMAEQASIVNNSARQATDRARAAKRLDPQVSMKEVRLVIDLPGEVKDVANAAASASNRRACGPSFVFLAAIRTRPAS